MPSGRGYRWGWTLQQGQAAIVRQPQRRPPWWRPPGESPPHWIIDHAQPDRWREGLSDDQAAAVTNRLPDDVVEAIVAELPSTRSDEHRAALPHLLRQLAAAMAKTTGHIAPSPDDGNVRDELKALGRAAAALRAQLAGFSQPAEHVLSLYVQGPLPAHATAALRARLLRDLGQLESTATQAWAATHRTGPKPKALLQAALDGLADVYEYVTGQTPARTRGYDPSCQAGAFADFARAAIPKLGLSISGQLDWSIRQVLEARARLAE